MKHWPPPSVVISTERHERAFTRGPVPSPQGAGMGNVRASSDGEICSAEGFIPPCRRRNGYYRLPHLRISFKNQKSKISNFFFLCLFCLCLSSCGYHTAGHAVRLPESLHTIAIPGFVNKTQTYRIEQILTRDVVREFISRTRYQVINGPSDNADATLKGIVVSTLAAPLTYDSQTGRASTAMVTVTLKITLTDQSGRVLFENQNYTFRDVYQVSREIASFFDEETPALQRMSRDFARTLVNDVLEAY